MKKNLFALTAFFAFAVSLPAATYYISPGGSDTLNNGLSVGFPFQTIQKAASIMTAGDTCLIRAGVYRETVVPANSGTSGSPIGFMAYNGEAVTVTGADLYTGSWSVYSGSIYQSACTDTFIQVFVDGHMMNEARWPNTPTDDLLHMVTATAQAGTNDTAIVDPSLPAGNWVGGYMWIQPGDGWGSYTRQITSYTPGGSLSWTSGAIGTGNTNYQPREGNPYYLFGSLAGLDTTSEWFLDTNAHVFYLWTPDSAAPGAHIVEVKKRNYAFDLNSSSYISIYNLNIFSTAINMQDSYYCIVDNCRVKYVDHYTQANGYIVGGGENNYMSGGYNEWKNSTIIYSAGCGIYVQGFNNKVTNCLIHDTGYMGSNHGAIMTDGGGNYAQTFGHVLSGNTIYNTGRFGIYHPGTRDLKIFYNDISYPGLLSKDCGPIYAYGLDAQYTEIAYNWTHDNYTTYGAGVYLDNGSNHHLVHHNVAWNCAGTGIVLNTPSEYNLIYNNTIFNCNKSFDYYGNAAQGLGNIESQLGSEVINNIAQNPMTFAHDPPATNNHNGNYQIDSNYMPLAGSGAIDAGVVIPGITDGYLGSAPDIGAYEYGAARWVPGYKAPSATPTAGGPAATFTRTPTITPTNTINLAPTIVGTMIDNLSDCDITNVYGGGWFSYNDSGNGGVSWIWPMSPFIASAPGYGGTDCAARVSGVVKFATGGYIYPEIDWGTDLAGDRDYSSCLGLRFKFKGDNRFYKIRLGADSSINTAYNDYKYTFFAAQGWQSYEIPFTSFTQAAGWGIIVDKGLILSKIKEIVFGTAVYPREGSQYTFDVSVDNLEIYGCGLATPTYTPTQTPTYNPGPPLTMIDDCEDNDGINLWGGYWYTYDDSANGGVSAVVPPNGNFYMASPGYNGAGYAARITGTVIHANGGYAYPFIAIGTNLRPSQNNVVDLSVCTGLRFWTKGDGRDYFIRIQCPSSIITDWNFYRFTFTPPASWTQVTIPLSSFTQASWGTIPVDRTLALQNANSISFQTGETVPAAGSQWDINLWVDNLEIYGGAGVPTYGPSPAQTPVVTPTITPTITIKKAADNLNNAHAFPSLFSGLEGHNIITFVDLTKKCKIGIFDMNGKLVFSKDVDSADGECTWTVTPASRNASIAPGLYIYIISNDRGELKRGKIAVIK